MIRDTYSCDDFDAAIIYLPQVKVFYVMPVEMFLSFGSSISFVESEKRQRKPKPAPFRERWSLFTEEDSTILLCQNT
jgi:hypothetical protein